jgi:hypothetical protein
MNRVIIPVMATREPIERRSFLAMLAAAGAGVVGWPSIGCAQTATTSTSEAAPAERPATIVEGYFRKILAGFVKNAAATSTDRSFAVCDFPGGTKLKTCCTPSGKTYVSVARMLPAMAEMCRRPNVDPRAADELRQILAAVYRHAFDPNHPDYWGEPPADRATQRTVESALVAMALHRIGEEFVGALSSAERANVNRWLDSCVRVPERQTNHAWFTAINQAVRLELSRTFHEFRGDEGWMLDDLAALDALFIPGNGGWYTDFPGLHIYDYYNFWVFANFPLFWARIIGARYPEWDAKFRQRVAEFLKDTPYFFAADGSHPLFGRSLIYRWALLSPMVLGYQMKLWPYSPGLLRRIVTRSLDWHWRHGAYDADAGKLRETYTPQGTPDVKEAYVDNGHPYWAMQAFTMLSLTVDDPLWTAPEERLPVEQGDFVRRFEGPRMILSGTKSSGQIKWVQARGVHRRDYYRDKYTKFSYSTHFPFNVILEKDRAPWDQALVLRNTKTGHCAGRAGVTDGMLLDDGVETKWWIVLDEVRFDVVSRIRLTGEYEDRTHTISAPPNWTAGDVQVLEGSAALGLEADQEPIVRAGPDGASQILSSQRSGYTIVTWSIDGFDKTIAAASTFGEDRRQRATTNLIYPRCAVNTLTAVLSARPLTVRSLHYATPRPADLEGLFAGARAIIHR